MSWYQCFLSYLEQQLFLLFLLVPNFWFLRLSISKGSQRQENCSDSCTKLVNPIMVPAVATDDQPGPTVFSTVRHEEI